MTSKKIILILSIPVFVVLFIIFGYYICLRQIGNSTPIAQKCLQIQNLDTKPIEENLDEDAEKEWRPQEWNTYYDERYKYSIDFPSGLNVATIYENTVELSDSLGGGFLTINGGTTFSFPEGGPGIISIEIYENTKFQSLDEWLESKRNEDVCSIVDKKINIDGNEAIVTHQVSMLNGKILEEFKREKTTVFIKDNNLFVIYTRVGDYFKVGDRENEKVWNSFKFITGEYPIY